MHVNVYYTNEFFPKKTLVTFCLNKVKLTTNSSKFIYFALLPAVTKSYGFVIYVNRNVSCPWLEAFPMNDMFTAKCLGNEEFDFFNSFRAEVILFLSVLS